MARLFEASVRMKCIAHFLLCFTACGAIAAHAADAPEKSFALTIVRGVLPAKQRVLRVEKNDAVRLTLKSDAPGEIHLHGYRLQAQITPDKPAEIVFKAYATGRYPLEWHGSGDDAATGAHRGPPLATLEVRPK
jgi:hypothetical protein